MYAVIAINTLHTEAFDMEVEAKRKAISSEGAKATAPSTGANKLKQYKPPRDIEPPARNSKPLNTKQRARLVKFEQQLDQVKEDGNNVLGSTRRTPYLSNFLPATLVHQSEKHSALVDTAVAEILMVLTEGWVGDCPTSA